MSERESDLQELLDFAVDLARGAGEITLHYFRNPPKAELKRDGSFVTAADREAEAYLRARISERFPQDAIFGEEEGLSAGTTERRWIVDPIDGTYAFVHGVPLYGVLLGLEIAGSPGAGVVNLPALDEMIYAARGLGCFWNGRAARVSTTSTLKESLLLSTDFGTCAAYGFGEAAAELQLRAHSRRTWGDCYGHALVATGRADVMLDAVMNIWDCAALLPIIEEAGGTFTDWHGRTTIDGGNAVSTNGALFDEVFEIINRTSKDKG
ncbi:MAG TPA: inositol monophosphatase family protein [Pyrinomonadaceae bacterium]|jgi:histidinol phosphatase-like enzyme (inositol monophosphatase family)|nr:inositol monophosphatase family protein [Pyrinomonadaceae bacterium]